MQVCRADSVQGDEATVAMLSGYQAMGMWTATQFLMSHGEKALPGRGAARTQAWGSRGSGCLWLVVGRPQILPG